MFTPGLYDTLTFPLPALGMNRFLSPEALPLDHAVLLENIIPLAGEGQVRYGTSKLDLNLPLGSTLIDCLPFTKDNGEAQLILYVQEFVEDGDVAEIQVNAANPDRVTFTTPHAHRYLSDAPLKMIYTFTGEVTLTDIITASVAEHTVTVTLRNNILPFSPLKQPQILNISYPSGTLYVYDLQTQSLSAPLRQNMAVACIPRFTTFLSTLILCNGVDPLLSWNGTTLQEIYDFVKEPLTNLQRVNDTTLSWTKAATFEPQNFQAGRKIRLSTEGVEFTITAYTLNGTTVTLTLDKNIPENPSQLFFQAWPPRFNFVAAAHDRLWALGPGAASRGTRARIEAMKVYYSEKTNAITGWFKESTRTVPSIDLSEKHGIPDNLEAIAQVGPYLAFIGRHKTQVWQGDTPMRPEEESPRKFIWNRTLPTGTPHGNLVISLPNDVLLVTATGLQTLGTLNIAQQFAATSLNAVDPLVGAYLTQMMSSETAYRASSSFRYDAGSLLGFKIGTNPVLAARFSTLPEAWMLLTGDFERASSFLSFGPRLFMTQKHALFQYADGKDGSLPLYGDQGGKALIPFTWTLPITSLQGKLFAGKRYELRVAMPSSFVLDDESLMTLTIHGDAPATYAITQNCRFQMQGDVLQTIPLSQILEEDVEEDSVGFRLDQSYAFLKDRFKFLAARFGITVQGTTRQGPLSLKTLSLYGMIERT